MNVFSLILGMLLLGQSAYAARICKTERGRSFAEQLATLEPKAELDLVDIDLFPGGSVVAGYEYEVEPAYTNGLYSRTDRWQVSLKAIPEKLINLEEGIDSKISGGFKTQTEATFIRFVNDPCLAMKMNPYSPRRIPLKASVAIGPKFNTGDYFLFRSSAGFVVSGEILSMIGSGLWGVGLSGSYLMEGYYQLHIVRLDQERIRLKVVAHRGRDITGSVGVGWESEFDVFSVNALNNALEKFVNTKPIKIKAEFDKSNVFMVDYVLNLTDPKVVEAFEAVLKKVRHFKNLDLTAPFKKQKDLEASLFLDLTPLEDLYQADRRENQVSRIKRNLRTTSAQDAYAFGVELGNKVVGYKWHKELSTSLMGVRREDNVLDNYLLKTWGSNWEGRFFYTWMKSSEQSGIRALFNADKSFQKLSPINIVSYINKRKNRISYKNFQSIRARLKKSLPVDVYRSIPWEEWDQTPKEKFTNFGLRYEFLMAPEGITEAPELSEEDIVVLFNDHLLRKGLTYRDFFSDAPGGPRNSRETAENRYNRELRSFAKDLARALDRDLGSQERLSYLTKLRTNSLFSDVGFSFFMALRPDKMKEWYHLDVNLSSNEARIDYSYGDSELSALYKKLLTIKAALDDDSLDLIREAESISSLPEAI